MHGCRKGCKQLTQLSQRDRAAGWVSFCQKWKELKNNILRTL